MSQPIRGQLAPYEAQFCPLDAVSKWPYSFLSKAQAKAVSDKYFAFGIFKAHGWSIYYIRTRIQGKPKPLLLVAEDEVRAWFRELSHDRDFGSLFRFPSATKDPGFCINFDQAGSPRPRYLGHLSSKRSTSDLLVLLPVEGSSIEEAESIDDTSLDIFKETIKAALASGRSGSSDNETRREARTKERVNWYGQMIKTQIYLNLRLTRDGAKSIANTLLTTDQNFASVESHIFPSISYKQSPLTRDPIWISLDIEWFERDPTKLTEIGVSTLDTRILSTIAPGPGGINWIKQIRSRHFRVKENDHYRSDRYVHSCPDRFETTLGRSEWISIRDVRSIIEECFSSPFSEPGKYTPHDIPIGETAVTLTPGSVTMPAQHADQRGIIIVGHAVKGDLDYLGKHNCSPSRLPNIIDTIDTTDLVRALKQTSQTVSLGKMLDELKLPAWNLHNAGNDAAYTLQVLIRLAVNATDETFKLREEPTIGPNETAARKREKEEWREWSFANRRCFESDGTVKTTWGIKAADELHEPVTIPDLPTDSVPPSEAEKAAFTSRAISAYDSEIPAAHYNRHNTSVTDYINTDW